MAFDPQAHIMKIPRWIKNKVTGKMDKVEDDYLEVKWRLVWFREKFPRGSIITEEVYVDLDREVKTDNKSGRGYARFKATVSDGEGGVATGYGTETAVDFGDFLEKAETKSVGRALAMLGIGTQFIGRDLSEGERIVDAPVRGESEPEETRTTTATEQLGTKPHERRPTQDEISYLMKLATDGLGMSMKDFRAGMRRLVSDLEHYEGTITSQVLQEHMSMAQYEAACVEYRDQHRKKVELTIANSSEDVPFHTPPGSTTVTPEVKVEAPQVEVSPQSNGDGLASIAEETSNEPSAYATLLQINTLKFKAQQVGQKAQDDLAQVLTNQKGSLTVSQYQSINNLLEQQRAEATARQSAML